MSKSRPSPPAPADLAKEASARAPGATRVAATIAPPARSGRRRAEGNTTPYGRSVYTSLFLATGFRNWCGLACSSGVCFGLPKGFFSFLRQLGSLRQVYVSPPSTRERERVGKPPSLPPCVLSIGRRPARPQPPATTTRYQVYQCPSESLPRA